MENFWSLLKRGSGGTYVSVELFHMFRYVDEQASLFNNRKHADGEIISDYEGFKTALSQIVGRRLTYKQLTGKEGQTASTELSRLEAKGRGQKVFRLRTSAMGVSLRLLLILFIAAVSRVSDSWPSMYSGVRFMGVRFMWLHDGTTVIHWLANATPVGHYFCQPFDVRASAQRSRWRPERHSNCRLFLCSAVAS